MKLRQMVDKLNELQHQLQAEKDLFERERLRLSINALTDAVKRGVREHNEKSALNKRS